jgi:hypothetical protein
MLTLPNPSWKRSVKGAKTPLALNIAFSVCILLILPGCAGLLPNTKQESRSPWHSYDDAQTMFAGILPGKTSLTELKALGVDPERTPNIAVLAHVDLLRRLIPVSTPDIRLLDTGLQECISAAQSCFAYEIEQKHVDRQRVGNFWMDFLNFKRVVNVSGWQFDAIVVIKNDTVIYKLWSGKPNIHQLEEEQSPLGPFQGGGISAFQH